MNYWLLVAAVIAASGLLVTPVPFDDDKPRDSALTDVLESSGHLSPSISPLGTSDLTSNSPSRLFIPRFHRGRRLGQRSLTAVFAHEFGPNSSNSVSKSSRSERIRHRYRRNANDEFSTSVDRMSKISRVVNGISIQQGLTKGSIPSDTLISELLNLGAVTPSSIQKLKSEDVGKLVENLQNLHTVLSEKKDSADRIEKRFLMYNDLLEATDGVKKGVEMKNKDAYLNEIRTLKTKTIDLTSLPTFVGILNTFLPNMEKLTDPSLPELQVSHLFPHIGLSLNEFKTSDLSSLSTTMKSEHLVNAESIFAPVKATRKGFGILQAASSEIFTYNKQKDNTPTEIVRNYLDSLNSIGKKSVELLPVLESLKNIFVSSVHRSGNRELVYTSGLPNGFTDLDSISSDLSDEWIRSVVDGQSESLVKALNLLGTLAESIHGLSDSLQSVPSSVVSDALKMASELSKLAGNFEKLSSEMQDIKIDTTPGSVTAGNEAEFDALFGVIDPLTVRLKAMDDVIKVSEALRQPEYAVKLKKLAEIAEKKDLNEMRSSQDVKDVHNLVLNIASSLEFLSQKTPMKPIADSLTNIESNFNQISDFVSKTDTFFDVLTPLRQKEGTKSIKSAMAAIEKYRGQQIDLSEFKKVMEVMPQVKEKMNLLQTTIEKFKDSDSGEVKALVELQDVLKDSQTVGSATRVFRSMEMMDKDRIVVLDQVTAPLIQNKMKKMDSEDQKALKQLSDLDTQLAVVYRQVDGVKKSATSSQTTSDLSSLHPIFLLAKSAPGVSTNFLEIGRFVVKLSQDPKLTPDQQKAVLDIKKKLETLDSIGLDFARHHSAIDESKKSLEQLDVFFSSFKSKVTAIPAKPGQSIPRKQPVAPPSNSNAPSGALGGGGASIEKKNDEKSDGFWDKYGIWIIVVLVLALIGSGVLIYFLFCRKSKKQDQKIQRMLAVPVNVDDVHKTRSKKEEPSVVQPLLKTKSEISKISKTKSIAAPRPPPTITVSMFEGFINDLHNAYVKNDKYEKPYNDLRTFYEDVYTEIIEKQGDLEETVQDMDEWQWRNTPLLSANRLKLMDETLLVAGKTPILHASRLKLNSGLEMYLMQGPQVTGPKYSVHLTGLKSKGDGYETVSAFWLAAIEKKCEYVVMWTRFGEDKKNRNGIITEIRKTCCQYFPLHQGDTECPSEDKNLEVRCEESNRHDEKKYTVRRLTASYKGKGSVTLKHILFEAWPEDGAWIPSNTDGFMDIIKIIRDSKGPVFMHCVAGTGPSAVAAYVLLSQDRLLESKGPVSPEIILPELRRSRAEAIDTGYQLLFANCLMFRLFYGTIEKKKLSKEVSKRCESIDDGFKKALKQCKTDEEEWRKNKEKKQNEAVERWAKDMKKYNNPAEKAQVESSNGIKAEN